MNFLSDWLLMLIPTCACAVCAEALFSSFSHSLSMQKYIRFTLSLCICSVIFMPAFSLLGTLPEKIDDIKLELEQDKEDFVSLSDEFVLSFAKQELEKKCADKIYERFGIKPQYVSIEFSVREQESSLLADICFFEIGLLKKDKEQASSVRIYMEELLQTVPDIKIVGG